VEAFVFQPFLLTEKIGARPLQRSATETDDRNAILIRARSLVHDTQPLNFGPAGMPQPETRSATYYTETLSMTSERIVALLMFLFAISCIMFSGFLMFAMIGQINRKVSDRNQISYLWGHPAKYFRIYSDYRRLYPEGQLLLVYKVVLYSGFGLLALFALCWRIGVFK
jgi:hypothetical protein